MSSAAHRLAAHGFVAVLAVLAVAGLAAVQPAVAAPAARATPAATGGLLVAKAQLHEAYLDHPVVAEVRGLGYLTIVTRERALAKGTPADRALAIVDAVGAEGAVRHAVDRFVTQALQARLAIGPSGALKARDITVDQLDARQALVLGWVRALGADGNVTVLTRRGKRLDQAGAVQLLEIAVAKAPGQQAAAVALALAKVAAEPAPKRACAQALELHKVSRAGGSEAIRLTAAERVAALAEPLQRTCKPKDLEPFVRPIQLPPPVAEAPTASTSGRPSRPAAMPGLHAGAHPFGIAFVTTAPIFPAYLQDPMVTRLASRTRLDEMMVEEVLKRDATGDLTVAVLNASVLMQRIGLEDNASVAWMGIVRRHGLLDAPVAQQRALQVKDLTGPEAMALGYAYALWGKGLQSRGPEGSAWTALPQELFAHGRALLPANAVLGPVMAHAHVIDLERQSDLCLPLKRVDALRFVVNRGTLGEPARAALLQALATVEAQCAASRGTQVPAQETAR